MTSLLFLKNSLNLSDEELEAALEREPVLGGVDRFRHLYRVSL